MACSVLRPVSCQLRLEVPGSPQGRGRAPEVRLSPRCLKDADGDSDTALLSLSRGVCDGLGHSRLLPGAAGLGGATAPKPRPPQCPPDRARLLLWQVSPRTTQRGDHCPADVAGGNPCLWLVEGPLGAALARRCVLPALGRSRVAPSRGCAPDFLPFARTRNSGLPVGALLRARSASRGLLDATCRPPPVAAREGGLGRSGCQTVP